MKAGVWILAIWLLTTGRSIGAENPGEWHPGELVLQNGSELSGEIKFNWIAQIVQCRHENRIRAFSASQVQTFTFFDPNQNAVRRFTAVAFPGKAGLRRPRILEQISVGILPVYRDLRPGAGLTRVVRTPDYTCDAEFSKDPDNFNYLVSADDALIPMDQFYRQVWPRIEGTIQQQQAYASLVRTDTKNLKGQLQILLLYNAMIDKDESEPEDRDLVR